MFQWKKEAVIAEQKSMSIEEVIAKDFKNKDNIEAKKWSQRLIQKNELVGELLSINYEKAKVIIHDHARRQVGGIPSLGFLLATRIDPEQGLIDHRNEDTSFILLRAYLQTPLSMDLRGFGKVVVDSLMEISRYETKQESSCQVVNFG